MVARERLSHRQFSGVGVALVVVSGIAINQLSDLFSLSAPLVIIGSVIVVVAMLTYEHMNSATTDDGSRGAEVRSLVSWCLASLLAGTIVAAAWRLPLLPDQTFYVPESATSALGAARVFFQGYELGGTLCISLIAAVAAIRRRSNLIRVAAFIVFAISGLTLVVAWTPSDPGSFDFSGTFFGWLLTAGLLTVVAAVLPDFAKLFGEFLGIGGRGTEPATDGPPPEEESQTGASGSQSDPPAESANSVEETSNPSPNDDTNSPGPLNEGGALSGASEARA